MIDSIRMLVANGFSNGRIKGRPNYYSTKKEEYAQIRFDLNAGTYLINSVCDS